MPAPDPAPAPPPAGEALSAFRQNAYATLRDTFGWSEFRPGQLAVLEALHEHDAALALFPTGGGKSLCYQLYSQLAGGGLTIVVSPLIALMKDQVDDMRARGIAAARIDSSLEYAELRRIRDDIRDGSLRLLYVAPERFNNENFRELVEGAEVALFAVDEAHCISQWGHNFRPDYLKLVDYARRLEARAVLALTATATPEVVGDICEALAIPPAAAITASAYRPNLFIDVDPTPRAARLERLTDAISEREAGTTIVYVTLQRTAEEVAAGLAAAGLPARAYHAGLRDYQRSAAQDEWMRGSDRIVVATIAFGMGIDKADVRYIYHYDLPKSLEGYVQEIGRAGRDGAPSRVQLLGNREDVPQLAAFTLGDTPAREDLRRLVEHLLGKGEHLEVSTYKLSRGFDIRQLTLATVLTYLELLGVLRQSTPRYGAFQVTPAGGEARLLNRVPATKRAWYKEVFAASAVGTKHINVDLAVVTHKTGRDREQLVKGINQLEIDKLAEVRPKQLMRVYEQLDHGMSVDAVVEELDRRFAERERADLARLDEVVAFAEVNACKTAYLLRYFGEADPPDCGHCAWCADRARDFSAGAAGDGTGAEAVPAEEVLDAADEDKLRALAAKYPRALGAPRKLARFLLGISSPGIAAARLGKHALNGRLAGYAFGDVFAAAERIVGTEP